MVTAMFAEEADTSFSVRVPELLMSSELVSFADSVPTLVSSVRLPPTEDAVSIRLPAVIPVLPEVALMELLLVAVRSTVPVEPTSILAICRLLSLLMLSFSPLWVTLVTVRPLSFESLKVADRPFEPME